MLWGLIGFLITIGFLVTIHEYGHFWMARRFGVKILRFSLGFGKAIFTYRGKKEGTLYTIAPIPLGGFVQMYGESDDEEVDAQEISRTFKGKKAWQRFLIAFAGPLVNLIFAVLAFTLLFMAGVKGLVPEVAYVQPNSIASSAGLQDGDIIQSVNGKDIKLSIDAHVALIDVPREEIDIVYQRDGEQRTATVDFSHLHSGDELKLDEVLGLYLVDEWLPAKIDKIVEGSAAEDFGLMHGDQIIAINHKPVDLIRIGDEIRQLAGKSASLTILRQGQEIELTNQIGEREGDDGQTIGFLGVRWQSTDVSEFQTVERYNIVTSLYKGIEKTAYYVKLTFDMFARMIMGQVSLDNVGGPLTIGDAAGQTMQIGWDVFLNFLGVVSLSLAAINLLPIPMLDGGHMLFNLIEMVKGKPLSDRSMTLAYRLGGALVMTFMAFVVLKDFQRYLL